MKQVVFKGWHYTLNLLNPFCNKVRNIYIDESCWYDETLQIQKGWNKLFGKTSFLIHRESIRIVWRPSSQYGYFRLGISEYHKGIRTIREIDLTESDEAIKIEFIKNEVLVNDKLFKFNAKYCWFNKGLYFGGQETAPHKMYITIIQV